MKKLYTYFTGGYEYYIADTGYGLEVQRMPDYDMYPEEYGKAIPECMLYGDLTKCLAYMRQVLAENYEYDHDI